MQKRLSNIREVQVVLNSDQKKSAGTLQIQEWNPQERMTRSLKSLGLCWGLAVASVIIPLAHFVLVPSFLLAGPILAFVVYSRERAVIGGSGTCPECKKPFEVARSAVKWPLDDLCPQCQSAIQILPQS